VFFNKYVHELVIIDTVFINAPFNYETYIKAVLVEFRVKILLRCGFDGDIQ
jgi:hypothetical protein